MYLGRNETQQSAAGYNEHKAQGPAVTQSVPLN